MSVHTTIRRDGSKAYLIRWREGAANRSRTFDRRADARGFADELRRRRQLGPLAQQQLTEPRSDVGQWIEQRWAPEHARTLAASKKTSWNVAPTLTIRPFASTRASKAPAAHQCRDRARTSSTRA